MIRDFLDDLLSYIALILTSGGNIITGGTIGLTFFLVSTLISTQINPAIIVTSVIIAFFISGFLLWRQEHKKNLEGNLQIKQKQLEIRYKKLNKIQDQMIIAFEAMDDVCKNLGLDWVALNLNKTYNYTDSYESSKNKLSNFVSIYMKEHVNLFREFSDAIYQFHLYRNKIKGDITKEQREAIYDLINDYYTKQSSLYSAITNSLYKLQEEVDI